MQRKFASNLALCATLYQANAMRLSQEELVFNSDGQQITVIPAEDGFLTLAQQAVDHTCTYVMDQHKSFEEDFYQTVNLQNQKWTDSSFPTWEAHYFEDGGSNETSSSMVSHKNTDDWFRISEHSFFNGRTLFGSEYIKPTDVRQGEIGNCWFMASMTALAEYPGRIEKMYLNKTLSKSGVYGIQMYALGCPITIQVDDQLPLRPWGSNKNTRYAGVGLDNSLWSPIMEKAFAKFHGNYARTVAGDPVMGVATLNGSPYERYWTSDASEDDIWQILSEHDHESTRSLLQAGTPCSGGGDDTTNINGLVNCHAYTILKVQQLTSGQKLIKMRNPWGAETFKGNYSDNSSEMTDSVRAELNHTSRNDGTFWMMLEHFKTQVQYIGINYDTDEWHHDYFLALDDNEEGSTAGQWNFCGASCTRYVATVKNMSETESNLVHVGAHTWRPRSIPYTEECSPAWNSVSRYHSIYRDGDRSVYTFRNDGRWIPAYELGPGDEMTYIVEIDLDREKMSQDWSITVWGENAPVKVTVADRTSSTFNHITEDNSKLPEDEGREGDNNDDENNAAAIVHAENAEKYRDEAIEHMNHVEEIMVALRQNQEALLKHVMNAAEEMQKAMNAKDRAKEEFEEAAGRLSVADGEEDPILTALKKNLSDAKEEADKAEQAAKDAKSEYEAAVEIKEGYAAEAESINESHEAAKKAMDNAEEEYKKAMPYDATDIQLAARERAQNAYQAAKMSFEAIEDDKKELEEMCEEAEEKIAEAMSSKTTAWMHKEAADEYIEKIRKIIEEYEAANGDEAAKSAADECERLRDELVEDGKTIADILAALKLKVEAILQHVKDAAEEMDKAKAARDMALVKLDEAKGKVNLSTGEGEGETDDQTLAELEQLLEDAQMEADKAEEAAKAAQKQYEDAKEVKKAFTEKHHEMEELLEKAEKAMNDAEEEYKKAQQFTETEAQQQHLERAKEAYDEAEAAYKAAKEDKEEVSDLCDQADKAIQEAYESKKSAWEYKEETDKAVKDIKDLIDEHNGGGGNGGDGDCHEEHKMKADQHLKSSEEGLEALQGHKEKIGEHLDELADHKQKVTDAKMAAKETYEEAMADPENLEALREHKENAKKNVEEACDALEVVEHAAQDASDVHDNHVTPAMNEFFERSEEIAKQKEAIAEMMKVLEEAQENLDKADGILDDAATIGYNLSTQVEDAQQHAKDAAECKKEAEEYLAKIEKLIEEAEGNGNDDEADDKAAQDLADEAEEQAGKAVLLETEIMEIIASFEELAGKMTDHIGDVDEMSGKAGLAMEAAGNLLQQAKETDGGLEALKEFLEAIEGKAKEAGDMADDAQEAYDKAMGMKPDFNGLMEQINKLVDDVEMHKNKTWTAYDDAKQYQNTEIQLEALNEAKEAYENVEGILNSLQEKETAKQKVVDDMMDNIGFAMNDVEDAVKHEEDAMGYVEDLEKMIEDASEAEGDQIAEDAADECHQAEEKLEAIKKEAEEDHKEIDDIKQDVDSKHETAIGFSGKVHTAYSDAEGKLENAKAEAGNLSALEAIYGELVEIEEMAYGHMSTAYTAADEAQDSKGQMSNLVGEIESEIDGARDLKQAAADAYEVAEKYQDTEAQKAFEEEARTAYFAAKEHLVAIEGLRDDAVDMKDKSDAKRDEATNEAEEASKVNFDSIFEEINTLIEDASNGGGDGTELENWLADFDVTDAFSNPCSAKSVMVEDKILGDGMKAFAFASNCPSRYLYVQMQGQNGVEWLPKVKEVTTDIEPTCTVNSRRKWQRCIWKIYPEDGDKMAFSVDPNVGNFRIVARMKNI